MGGVRGMAGALRRRTALADALLAVVLATAFLVLPHVLPDGGRHGEAWDLTVTGGDVAVTLVSAAALTQLRRLPLATLVVTAAATFVGIVADLSVNLGQLATTIALYSFALRRPREHAVVAAGVTSVVLGVTSVLGATIGGQSWGRQNVILWLWTAAGIGLAVQGRRATIAALQDRARRAEETREETALRRVAEDRVRIARELHDAIAHHVAVISVQAGVAEHLVGRDPAAAAEALHHVRGSAKAVLAELQSVLGVLRQDEADLPTAPTPDLSHLDELVASFRSIGMPVTVETSGPPARLAPAADLAAFRLVQEALTNVQKHATGARARVMLAVRGDRLELTVANERPPARADDELGWSPAGRAAATGSGLGLVGMRERVAAAGGELRTGPTKDGGFRVEANLPLAVPVPSSSGMASGTSSAGPAAPPSSPPTTSRPRLREAR